MLKRIYSTKYKCLSAIEKGFTADIEKGIVYAPSGKIVTKTTLNGYLQMCVRLGGQTMYLLVHQFIYYLVNKKEVELIDHINEDKKDNRISNLRSVNKKVNAYNSSKTKGVYFDKRNNKFSAHIMIDGINKFLGYFESENLAKEKYLNYKKQLIEKQITLCN